MVMVERGVVKPRGPNQRATCSGSVHAFQTSSRGASKTRVIVNSRSTGVSAIALRLQGTEVVVEAVQAGLEELPGSRQPTGAGPPGRPPLGGAPPGHGPRVLQRLQVLGHRLNRDREGPGQLVDRRLAVGQALEDRPAGGVGKGREGGAELVDRHVITRTVDEPNG